MQFKILGLAILISITSAQLVTDYGATACTLYDGQECDALAADWFNDACCAIITTEYSDGTVLDIYRATAPEASMKVLFGALVFGILTIFPALYYLFKIFN